jgi:hypothetical protein
MVALLIKEKLAGGGSSRTEDMPVKTFVMVGGGPSRVPQRQWGWLNPKSYPKP